MLQRLGILLLLVGSVVGCAEAGDEPDAPDDTRPGSGGSTASAGGAASSSDTSSSSASNGGGGAGMGGAGGGGCDDCAGALAWVKPAGGGDRDYAYGVSVAADGSVYVTGTFGDDATWNPGEADATERSASQNDMFVARYAADGSLLWVKDTAGNAEDEGSRAGVVDGGVVVTGWVTDGGSVVLGEGETNETTLSSTGLEDVFVARYDDQGALVWARAASGADTDRPSDIATLPSGRSIVVGRHWDDVTFGVGELGEVTLVGDGTTPRLFVASYAPDGNLEWAKSAGGTASVYGQAVAVDTDGSVVVTGVVQAGTATFDTVSLSPTGGSMFLARYASDGALTWATLAGESTATQGAEGRGVAITSSGDIVVVSSLFGEAVYGAGETNEETVSSTVSTGLVVSRHSADGTLVHTRAVNDTYCWSYDVVATQDDGVVLSGIMKGSAQFGAGEPNQTTITAPGMQNDAFVARLDATGALRWVRQIGGADPARGDYGYAVAMAPDDAPVVIGQFAGVATFGAGDANETFLAAAGKHDAFVAKLSP